ncbi:MAG: BatA and WFA domain-containing protein [Sandaracinaceae bacterium]|nr:BatA and WFA domain-containing protein [Sandaracinaceae bacterium]
MSFAAFAPWIVGAIAGGIALAVLALYLLRRTPRPQVVSNVRFWMRAVQSSRPRFLRASRIPWIAFLVSLLVALLFVTEIGDPRFGRGVRGITVIVVGAGRSMGAQDGGQTRIERAMREVRAWVDRSTVGGRVAVVRAGMRPTTLLAITEDPADLDRALEGFELDDGPADLEGALALADRIVERSGEQGQILLVADRDVEMETRATRVNVPVGTPVDTIAIVDLTSRRDPLAAGEYVVQCQVRSFASRRARARLRILDGETPILDRRITLRPGEGAQLTAQGFSAARAELTARLEEIELTGSTDAFALDDVAHSVVDPLEPLAVLLVTPGNPYLQAALEVHPNARVERLVPAAFSGKTDAELAAYDVLVLDRVGWPEVRNHPSVLLFSPPDGLFGPGAQAVRPRISASLASHPALNGVRFDGVRIGRALRYATEAGDQVLLRSGADAIAVARETPSERTLAFGVDLGATDLVERDAFPLFVHDAMHWAASAHSEIPLPRRLGEPLFAAADQTVLGPDGEPVDATERAEIRHQGIYHSGERALAFSGAEHASALSAGATGSRFRQSTPLPPLAILVAALLLLAMLVEWALLHRGRLE